MTTTSSSLDKNLTSLDKNSKFRFDVPSSQKPKMKPVNQYPSFQEIAMGDTNKYHNQTTSSSSTFARAKKINYESKMASLPSNMDYINLRKLGTGIQENRYNRLSLFS